MLLIGAFEFFTTLKSDFCRQKSINIRQFMEARETRFSTHITNLETRQIDATI